GDGNAPLLGALHDFQRVGVLEQRLGRNTAPNQAGAAERLLLLDHRHFEAELCGANRRHVAAGAGADDDDVVFVSHFLSEDSGTKVVAAGAAGRGAPVGSGSLTPVVTSSRAIRARSWPAS